MSAPKPRREPSLLERDVLRELKSATLPIGSAQKRFVRDLPEADSSELRLTERQADYILFLGYTFRRQFSDPFLLKLIFCEWQRHPERIEYFSHSGELARMFPPQTQKRLSL